MNFLPHDQLREFAAAKFEGLKEFMGGRLGVTAIGAQIELEELKPRAQPQADQEVTWTSSSLTGTL